MIYIPIILIIIILAIDFYLYPNRFDKIKDTFTNSNNFIEFLEPNPWSKIYYNSKIKKYYVKINNVNKYIDQIIVWKQLPFIRSDMLDIDIDNDYLIIKTISEEESLVLCNLIISYINNDLTIEEVISKNLINSSINKAKKYKLVTIKLIELIKDGLLKINNPIDNQDDNYNDNQNDNQDYNQTVTEEKFIQPIYNINDPLANNIQMDVITKEVPFDTFMTPSKIIPYEGGEYASISF